MPRSFLIDTDVASDDAVALIMALRAPDVRVVAITTVAGNVEVQQATRNALYTVELCGSRRRSLSAPKSHCVASIKARPGSTAVTDSATTTIRPLANRQRKQERSTPSSPPSGQTPGW